MGRTVPQDFKLNVFTYASNFQNNCVCDSLHYITQLIYTKATSASDTIPSKFTAEDKGFFDACRPKCSKVAMGVSQEVWDGHPSVLMYE